MPVGLSFFAVLMCRFVRTCSKPSLSSLGCKRCLEMIFTFTTCNIACTQVLMSFVHAGVWDTAGSERYQVCSLAAHDLFNKQNNNLTSKTSIQTARSGSQTFLYCEIVIDRRNTQTETRARVHNNHDEHTNTHTLHTHTRACIFSR